jgi:hypothetical protein
MSYLPQQYYGYYPAEYQPQFWQALVGGVIDIVIMIALGAWALSLVKKALKGEEVDLR